MSRTEKAEPLNYYGREASWARRIIRRLERRRARDHLAHERFDQADTRQTKNTQGWLTH